VTTLEKLGTIALAYALHMGYIDAERWRWASHATMFLGSVLLLVGGEAERWLRERFPGVRW